MLSSMSIELKKENKMIKNKSKSHQITIRMKPDEYEQLFNYAHDNYTSMSNVGHTLLKDFLKKEMNKKQK